MEDIQNERLDLAVRANIADNVLQKEASKYLKFPWCLKKYSGN